MTNNRTERVLGFMIASSIGLSILAMLALIIASSAGVDVKSGVMLTVAVLPGIGLILAAILIIVRVALSLVKRSRAAKDAAN